MYAVVRPARAMTEPSMQPGNARRGRRRQQGSVFLGMLVAVALVAVMLMQTGTLWSSVLRREREADLLARGGEIRRAIGLYYQIANTYPKTLDELLQDRRQPTVKRYLRRVYHDPLSGKPDWGIVKGPGDTIMGVYSQAKGTPFKQGNFRKDDRNFSGQSSYQGWLFLYSPGQSSPPPRNEAPGGPATG